MRLVKINSDEFRRAVKISTGEVLSENLIAVIYAIFDKDGDGMVKTD